MLRSVILTYWEIRRILRSHAAMASVLAVPVVLAVVHLIISHKSAETWLEPSFPLAAAAAACVTVYTRSALDRTSGFAAGLDSTSSAGGIVLTSRAMIGVLIALVQIAVFNVITRLLG
jgi:hypothetical protein